MGKAPTISADADVAPAPAWPSRVVLLSGTMTPQGAAAAIAAGGLAKETLLSNEFERASGVENVCAVVGQCSPNTETVVVSITLDTQHAIIEDLAKKQAAGERIVVFNLCDGTETDGYPGIGVVQHLQKSNIPFTGADADFFEGTTSKPVLKQKLVAHGVPTSPFVEIRSGFEEEDVEYCEKVIKEWPMIIKPSISYASLSISDKSVVRNRAEAVQQARAVLQSTQGGVFVETFLAGREFTALCTGDDRVGVTVYLVAERVFNSYLKTEQRLLSFDQYWEGCNIDGSKSTGDKPQFYWYEKAPDEWQDVLQDMARRAYIACGGNGYGRVDIRTRSIDKPDALVLEVNANCGLSFEAGSSSLGEILNLSKVDPVDFCRSMVNYAMIRPRQLS